MRNMKSDKLRRALNLYAVTDRRWLDGRNLYDDVKLALEGGAGTVQLREKDLDSGSFLREAIQIKNLCKTFNVPFIVNDNLETALKSDADGLHVGQCDTEAQKARQELGTDKILGVSVQTVEQALKAEEAGADYLGVGAVFPTGSKTDAAEVSTQTLKEICAAVNIPVVAIGGITKENIKLLKNSGIAGVAVISAIFAAEDIKKAAEELKLYAEEAFL